MENGSAPVFGYPPICYSPPNELKKTDDNREYINVLMRHVFAKGEIVSLKDIINAKKSEDRLYQILHKRWMSGERSNRIAGGPYSSSQDRANFLTSSFGD